MIRGTRIVCKAVDERLSFIFGNNIQQVLWKINLEGVIFCGFGKPFRCVVVDIGVRNIGLYIENRRAVYKVRAGYEKTDALGSFLDFFEFNGL